MNWKFVIVFIFSWACLFGWIGGCAASMIYEKDGPGIYFVISAVCFFIIAIIGGWDV